MKLKGPKLTKNKNQTGNTYCVGIKIEFKVELENANRKGPKGTGVRRGTKPKGAHIPRVK